MASRVIEARKHATSTTAETDTDAAPRRRSRTAVITLGARRRAALPDDGRPAPSVRDYDQLLAHPPAGDRENS